jgi:hypothetical protein
MSYKQLGEEIGALVETKQAAYGNSFGKSGAIMRILYPEGIPTEKMDDALTVVRVLDKLFRIATARDALGESPWRDVAGYALLSVARVETVKGDDSARDAIDLRESTWTVSYCSDCAASEFCREPTGGGPLCSKNIASTEK